MIIVDKVLNKEELQTLAETWFGDMVKGVADIDRGIIALDAELHSDLEQLLLENGSKQKDLWGFNIYPEELGDDFIEYDSLINIRPGQGNRSRGVEDDATREKLKETIIKWVNL